MSYQMHQKGTQEWPHWTQKELRAPVIGSMRRRIACGLILLAACSHASRAGCEDTMHEKLNTRIVSAKSAESIELAYQALGSTLTDDMLLALKDSPFPSVSLQAAWEQLRRRSLSCRRDVNQDNVPLLVDGADADTFVLHAEKIVSAPCPTWWKQAIVKARIYDDAAFIVPGVSPLPSDSPGGQLYTGVELSDANDLGILFFRSGVTIRIGGNRTALTVVCEGRTCSFPMSLLDASDTNYLDIAAAHDDQVTAVIHDWEPKTYLLYCLAPDAEYSAIYPKDVEWQSPVIVGNALIRGRTGSPPWHWTSLVNTESLCVVWGLTAESGGRSRRIWK